MLIRIHSISITESCSSMEWEHPSYCYLGFIPSTWPMLPTLVIPHPVHPWLRSSLFLLLRIYSINMTTGNAAKSCRPLSYRYSSMAEVIFFLLFRIHSISMIESWSSVEWKHHCNCYFRIHSISMTNAANSGHPLSCSSMAEIISVIVI
jgi:hypothetical protein